MSCYFFWKYSFNLQEYFDSKQEEQATFLSPAEDESCREVFGFIKKLNVVPDTKKAKTPCKICHLSYNL